MCRSDYQQGILDTEQQHQYIVSYILFYIMSSLRELKAATFTPDLLETCSQICSSIAQIVTEPVLFMLTKWPHSK